jgi:hypothetical protein
MFAKYRRIQGVTELTEMTDCLINITEAWRWLQIRDRAVFSVITVHTGECDSWFTFNSPFFWLCHLSAMQYWKEDNNCTPNVKTRFAFLIPRYLISMWSHTSGSASISTTQIKILISVFLSLIKLSRHIIFTCKLIKLPHLGTSNKYELQCIKSSTFGSVCKLSYSELRIDPDSREHKKVPTTGFLDSNPKSWMTFKHFRLLMCFFLVPYVNKHGYMSFLHAIWHKSF